MLDNANKVMLSTIDNPYDPFTQFDEWNRYDLSKGYNTLAYLARVTNLSDDLTEAEYNDEINSAISQALELNITGNYIKVIEGSFIKRSINSKV
jgi:hypothetical protein